MLATTSRVAARAPNVFLERSIGSTLVRLPSGLPGHPPGRRDGNGGTESRQRSVGKGQLRWADLREAVPERDGIPEGLDLPTSLEGDQTQVLVRVDRDRVPDALEHREVRLGIAVGVG